MSKWPNKALGEVAPIDAVPVRPVESPDKVFFYVALENIQSSGASRSGKQ